MKRFVFYPSTYIIYTRFLYYFFLCLCKSFKELSFLCPAPFFSAKAGAKVRLIFHSTKYFGRKKCLKYKKSASLDSHQSSNSFTPIIIIYKDDRFLLKNLHFCYLFCIFAIGKATPKDQNVISCGGRHKIFARPLQDIAPPAARICHGRGKLITFPLATC